MTDPLSITLAAITLGTTLKDLTELALKLHGSFKKHAHNMRAAESLAADTLDIVQAIENFYIARGDVLNNLPDVRDAVERLSKDMQSVYKQCLPILQLANSSERGLRRTLLKVELWRSRKAIELNIRNLREQANKCYRRFTRDTQLGAVVAIGELKSAVSEVSATTRKLSALQVSDENVLAFMVSPRGVLSTLPPGVTLAEDLVFKLCVRSHVGKIDKLLKNLAWKRSYAVKEPNDCHVQPFTTYSFLVLQTSDAVEHAQGYTVTKLIKVHKGLMNAETGGTPIQEGAYTLDKLAIGVARLELYSESVILDAWSVELYKTLAISDREVYAPWLALASYNLAVAFYRTGHFAQAMTMTTECLSLLKTCSPTFGTEALTARMLSESAHFRHAIGEHPSASLQDAEDSVAIWARLGTNQKAIIDPQQRGPNYTDLGVMTLGVRDSVVQGHAFALNAQRIYLYASQKYQAALDAGQKALQLFRALAQCYKHIAVQSQVATLCLFLCDDVFRDVIPLSSALVYAQEAVQIWEEARGPTAAEEEGVLDSLAIKTKILAEMGRPSDAILIFQKLARSVRFVAANQRMYIHKMQDLASMLFNKHHYAESATASRTIVELCRQSIDSLATSQRFLVDVFLDHIKHCDCANYLSEALIYSQETLAIAGQQCFKDPAIIEQYSFCFTWPGYLSLDAGYPQQTIKQCEDAINIISSLSRDGTIKLNLISVKAIAYLRLGQLNLAAVTIIEGYDFAESTTLNLRELTCFGEVHYVSALVQRCAGKQDDALTAIKASIPISGLMNWEKELHVLSDLHADMGHDAEALRTAEEAVQSTEGYYAFSSSPLVNHTYRASQYSLCLRLFFNGEFNRARQLILEVRRFYEWHAHSRNSWFIDLARALRAEGILECASDRHAEGAAARTRLNELQERLRSTLPGVADQVDVDLNYERNYPAWKRLLEKYPLTCSHWVEDGAASTREHTSCH
ncbi:hypothetical protein CPC08DRAFT_243662 [Agrocybe pediades]|nr:hypothetical protein CPC08DRAFT_243662 [Agrocybe pediades]